MVMKKLKTNVYTTNQDEQNDDEKWFL